MPNLPSSSEFFKNGESDPSEQIENHMTTDQKNISELPVHPEYNPIEESIKNFGDNSYQRMVNPYQLGKVQPFGAGVKDHAFERYYEHPKFNSLGFTPFRDNESFYNERSSTWDDFQRSWGQFGRLFGLGFKDAAGFGSLTDIETAREYEKAMAIGQSSQGGVGGFGINLFMNFGYTAGIMAEMASEELLLGLAGLGTGGSAWGVGAVRGAQKVSKLKDVWNAGKNTFKALENLQDINKARAYFRNATQSAGKFLNPLEHTTDLYKLSKTSKFNNLDNMAKTSAGIGAFYRDIRNLRLVYGESALEGGMVQNQMEEKLLAAHYEKYDRSPTADESRKIKETANAAGQSTAFWNMPVIFLSNKFVFENLNAPFLPTRKLMTDIVSKNVGGKIIRSGAKVSPYQIVENNFKGFVKGLRNPRSYARTGLNYFRANFAEGVQETLQETISGATRDYYTENFNSPVRGGVYSYIGDNIEKQITPEGGEVFLSGFLMGGMATTVTKPIKYGAERIQYKTKGVDYQKLKAEKLEQLNKTVNTLNEMYDKSMQYFAPDMENMVNQQDYQKGMKVAADNGDMKTWYDLKDASVFEHIYTALQNNRIDDFVDLLGSYKQMNEEEIKDATDGAITSREDFERVLDGGIRRAKTIQNRYELANKKFPNPFNPYLYKGDEQIEEWNRYGAFEGAKRTMIFMNHSFDRALDRMNSLKEEVVLDSDLKNVANFEFDPLMGLSNVTGKIVSLKEEIAPLQEQELISKEAKEHLKAQENRLTLLEEFADALTEYFSVKDAIPEKNRDQIVTDDNDQPVEVEYPQERKAVKRLKKTYDNYLKHLASVSKDHVFNESIDRSFQKLLDYYQLDSETQLLSQAVNALTDPEGFLRHVRDHEVTREYLKENKKLHIEETLSSYRKILEDNDFTQALHEKGMFFDPDELPALLKEGKLPSKFYYSEGRDAFNPVPENSEDYNTAFELAMRYVEQVREEDRPEKPDVYADREPQKVPGDKRNYSALAEQFGFDPKKAESSVPLKDILQAIMDSEYASEEERLLAKKLHSIALPGEFVTFARNMTQPGTYAELTQSKVDPRYAASDFTKQEGATLETTILKQEVKRQTFHGIKGDPKFRKEIGDLFNRVTEHYNQLKEQDSEQVVDVPFGLNSHSDFIAEAMVNSEFQVQLADIRYEGTVGSNSWTGFIDVVLRMLKRTFGKNTSNNALNAALHIITTRIEKEAGVGKPLGEKPVTTEITRYTNPMDMPEELRAQLIQAYKDYNTEREANFETVSDRNWKDKTDDELARSVQFQIYLEQGLTRPERIIREYTKPEQVTERTEESVKIITRKMKSQLKDLGYSDVEIGIMSPGGAVDIINKGISKFEQQAEREAMEESKAEQATSEGKKAADQINKMINDATNLSALEQAKKDISVIISDHKIFSQSGLTSNQITEMMNAKKRELAFTVQADQLRVGEVVIMNDNYSNRMVVSKINPATIDLHRVGDITFTRRVKKKDVTEKVKYRYSEVMEELGIEKEKVTDAEKKLTNEDVKTAQQMNDQHSIAEDIKMGRESDRGKLVDDIFEDIEICD